MDRVNPAYYVQERTGGQWQTLTRRAGEAYFSTWLAPARAAARRHRDATGRDVRVVTYSGGSEFVYDDVSKQGARR